jgi:hypothetical protein
MTTWCRFPKTPSPVFLTCVVIDAAPLTASRTYPTSWDQKCYPYTYGAFEERPGGFELGWRGGNGAMSDLNTSIRLARAGS